MSKEQKRKLLFNIPTNNVVTMPVLGHWNNDTGCRVD